MVDRDPVGRDHLRSRHRRCVLGHLSVLLGSRMTTDAGLPQHERGIRQFPVAGVNVVRDNRERSAAGCDTLYHPSGDACWRAGERGAAADHRTD